MIQSQRYKWYFIVHDILSCLSNLRAPFKLNYSVDYNNTIIVDKTGRVKAIQNLISKVRAFNNWKQLRKQAYSTVVIDQLISKYNARTRREYFHRRVHSPFCFSSTKNEWKRAIKIASIGLARARRSNISPKSDIRREIALQPLRESSCTEICDTRWP